MIRALVVRVAQALGTAWLIASAVFLLSRGTAGGTPQLFADERGGAFGQQASAEQQYQQRLGLQAPLFYFRLRPWHWHGTPNQYHTWLTQLAHGHLGHSFRDGVAVEEHLRTALQLTLPLTLSALLLAAVAALLLAQWAARRPGWYRWLVPASYFLDSLPLFVIGMLLLTLLASPDFWPLFPTYGLPSDFATTSGLSWPLASYFVLPVAALSLAGLPSLFLPLAAALRAQWQQPYVDTARAKGVSRLRTGWRHVLPNALPVFIARLGDLLPSVVAGAVVIEVVFALPGMGQLLATAAAARDVPVLIGGVLLLAVVRLLAWLAADLVNARLDPRFR